MSEETETKSESSDCSPLAIARMVKDFAECEVSRAVSEIELFVWPAVEDGVPGFTISVAGDDDVFRFVPTSKIFWCGDEPDESWIDFADELEEVAKSWRECIAENAKEQRDE